MVVWLCTSRHRGAWGCLTSQGGRWLLRAGTTGAGGWGHHRHHRSPTDLPTCPGPGLGGQASHGGSAPCWKRGPGPPEPPGRSQTTSARTQNPLQVGKLRPKARPRTPRPGRDRARHCPALSLSGCPPAPRGFGSDPNATGPGVTVQRDRGSVVPPVRGTERPRGISNPPKSRPPQSCSSPSPRSTDHSIVFQTLNGRYLEGGNVALADPAVSAKDGTAPVTRDTQGPPHLGMTGFSISPPGARSCRVSSTAVSVCLGRGPGVHAHTRVRTLARTPGRAVNSLPIPFAK